MGLLTLLFALGDTIFSTIREGQEEYRAAEEKRRYEDINFSNIAYVTFDGTTQAYRTEIREEFDPEMTYFLTQQDGWQHYELKEVEYEVEDGADYLFTIHFKDGSEIYRKFHESSPLTKRLLEYSNRPFAAMCEDSYVIEGDTLIINGVGNTASPDDDPSQDCFVVIDFETTGVNYKNRFSQMDEILSVAIIDQDENVLLHTYCDTVNIKTWYEAQRVNGISPSDVKGYPTFAEILPRVVEILSSYDYVISYNIPFEKGFLESYAQRYMPTDFSLLDINWGEDPMQLFMNHIGSDRYQKLITAASHFGYSYNAHDALADTKAALYVYKRLKGISDRAVSPQRTTEPKQLTPKDKAVLEAKSYLYNNSFSYLGLIKQLKYEKFTEEEATYGVDNCGADWKEQAVKNAKSYLYNNSFSYLGLIKQLKYEKFTEEEATYGVDNCGADWKEQAVKSAKSYLYNNSFSYLGLIKQLKYEKFTEEEATYGVDNCGADWKEQAVKNAKSYLIHNTFSYSGLIDQLEYAQFTAEEAKYGADNCGADWKEQAVKEAKKYLEMYSCSKCELIGRLKRHGFTEEEAFETAEKVMG